MIQEVSNYMNIKCEELPGSYIVKQRGNVTYQGNDKLKQLSYYFEVS